MAELKGLKAQRSVAKGLMTKLLSWVNALDPNADVDDITSRLNRAKELLLQFTNIEGRILMLDSEQDSLLSEFNDTFLSVESGLNRALEH